MPYEAGCVVVWRWPVLSQPTQITMLAKSIGWQTTCMEGDMHIKAGMFRVITHEDCGCDSMSPASDRAIISSAIVQSSSYASSRPSGGAHLSGCTICSSLPACASRSYDQQGKGEHHNSYILLQWQSPMECTLSRAP